MGVIEDLKLPDIKKEPIQKVSKKALISERLRKKI